MRKPTRAELHRQLDQCVQTVARYPGGVTLRRLQEDLVLDFGVSLPRRTVIRRLRELVEEDVLQKSGRTNRCRYFLKPTSQVAFRSPDARFPPAPG